MNEIHDFKEIKKEDLKYIYYLDEMTDIEDVVIDKFFFTYKSNQEMFTISRITNIEKFHDFYKLKTLIDFKEEDYDIFEDLSKNKKQELLKSIHDVVSNEHSINDENCRNDLFIDFIQGRINKCNKIIEEIKSEDKINKIETKKKKEAYELQSKDREETFGIKSAIVVKECFNKIVTSTLIIVFIIPFLLEVFVRDIPTDIPQLNIIIIELINFILNGIDFILPIILFIYILFKIYSTIISLRTIYKDNIVDFEVVNEEEIAQQKLINDQEITEIRKVISNCKSLIYKLKSTNERVINFEIEVS